MPAIYSIASRNPEVVEFSGNGLTRMVHYNIFEGMHAKFNCKDVHPCG